MLHLFMFALQMLSSRQAENSSCNIVIFFVPGLFCWLPGSGGTLLSTLLLLFEMITRKKTKEIKVGKVTVGGNSPVSVQSMTNTDTRDVEATVSQIKRLEQGGCEIIRVAVPDMDSASAFAAIKEQINIPLIADIHFDGRLAVAAMEKGADGIRINPGNIGGRDKISRVVAAALAHKVSIRVGVNGGSLEKEVVREYGYPTAENPQALIVSALNNVRTLEKLGFYEMKISIKSSDVLTAISAYRSLSAQTDYPLHIGVTEAGGLIGGTVKSSVALGALLLDGIGDTLRISLTRDPAEELKVAWELLRALKLRVRGPEMISCPTCGRTKIAIFSLADQVDKYLQTMTAPIKVAVMGCVVNGPGEAKEADIGIAGGKGEGIIFMKGKLWKKLPENELLPVFLSELDRIEQEYKQKG